MIIRPWLSSSGTPAVGLAKPPPAFAVVANVVLAFTNLEAWIVLITMTWPKIEHFSWPMSPKWPMQVGDIDGS